MGIVKIPNTQDYWAKENIMPSHIVSKLMTCSSFLLIMKFLHLSDIRMKSTRQIKED